MILYVRMQIPFTTPTVPLPSTYRTVKARTLHSQPSVSCFYDSIMRIGRRHHARHVGYHS